MTIVSAGDDLPTKARHAHHVARMALLIRLHSRWVVRQIDVVEIGIGAPEEEPPGILELRHRERDVFTADLLDRLEIADLDLWHRRFLCRFLAYAKTCRMGSIPGFTSGTGRAPTWYSFVWEIPRAPRIVAKNSPAPISPSTTRRPSSSVLP